MDQIYYNANIVTLDAAIPKAEAVAVKNGIIFRVGSNEEVLRLATKDTKLIDLKGRLATPAFADSHMHLIHYANTKKKIDLTTAKSFASIIEMSEKAINNLSKETDWLLGWGWNQDLWDLPTLPTRYDLDKISREVPIALTRTCYHVTVVNSIGLKKLGITKETVFLNREGIECDESGEPNGILREDAQNIIWEIIGAPSIQEIKEMIVSACDDALKQGISMIHTDDFEAFAGDNSELIMRAYSELAMENRLPIKIYQQCIFRTPEMLNAFLDKGHKTGNELGFYKIGPLKLLADGSLGARSAYLGRPYDDDPCTEGILLYTRAELETMVKLGHNNNMQIAIHCIGIAAINMAVDCVENAMIENPRIDPRHGMVHCQITDPTLLRRFQKLNLIAYAQPIFMQHDHKIVDTRVGCELASSSYNWRHFLDLGVHLACGSDCPVEKFDVLPNIYCAVTRKDFEGMPVGGWYPENRITLDEAVKTFTTENAYAAYQENERGTISIGRYADIVVLDENIFNIPVEQIKEVQVNMTIVNGEIKYQRLD